jgi:hypothetical protein
LIFLFSAIVIGTFIMHPNTVFPKLQQTVVLFVIGMVYSLFLELSGLVDSFGVFGQSYTMWMAIDPHTPCSRCSPCSWPGMR